MSDTEEIAKAIQESAKFGVQGLAIAEQAGSFFAKVLQQPAEEISGMLTDKLRFIRWKNAVKMSNEVDRILKNKGVKQTRPVSPKIALSIFEEASFEDDPNLQYLWSHLLANAMNPEFNDEIRYGFIDMIKNITAIEVNILNKLYKRLPNKFHPFSESVQRYSLTKNDIIMLLDLRADVCSISINNLMRMQLIEYQLIRYKPVKGEYDRTSYESFSHIDNTDLFNVTDNLVLTQLGIKFVESCTL